MLNHFMFLFRYSLEAQSNSKDWLRSLSCLHCSGDETLAVPDSFDVICDWDFGISSQNKVAVHRVDTKLRWYSLLSSREALSNDCSSKYTSCTRWMPKRSCVCEHILGKDYQSGKGTIKYYAGLTGSISDRFVNSSVFSISDLDGSGGGGLIKVAIFGAGMWAT